MIFQISNPPIPKEDHGSNNSASQICFCARATRAITSHAPIGEYRLRFFRSEDFSCLCGSYPIETRCHILYDCRRFNKYRNPMRDMINQLVSLLEFNPNEYAILLLY